MKQEQGTQTETGSAESTEMGFIPLHFTIWETLQTKPDYVWFLQLHLRDGKSKGNMSNWLKELHQSQKHMILVSIFTSRVLLSDTLK